MATRTKKQINDKVKELNKMLGLPDEAMTGTKRNIGHISADYLKNYGYALEQVSDDLGGVSRTVLGKVWFGRVPAKVMLAYLNGVLNGMRAKR